jgi:hypothetical protein
MYDDEDIDYSEEYSSGRESIEASSVYNPNGKSYPLKLQVREPTPEDLIKSNEKGTLQSSEEEFKFTELTKEQALHLEKRFF